VWSIALLLLYFSNPDQHHMTLCPLSNLGFDHCPGCGLGRSIALLMHGKWEASFNMHPLGWFGFGLLVYRIIKLLKDFIHSKTHKHGQNA
jgi:hypothetical protein